MNKTILLAGLLFMGAAAHAQVYQCTNAAGQSSFSDHPCDTASVSGKQIQRARSPDEIAQEREAAANATEQKYRQRAAERDQQQFDQQMDSARQQQAIQSRPTAPRQSDTLACTHAKKELDFVSSIRTLSKDEMRLRTNAAITNVNAACGSNTPLMQEPPKIDHTLQPVITRCDADRCYDSLGTVFTRTSPDLLNGPNGRYCNRSGAHWICQ